MPFDYVYLLELARTTGEPLGRFPVTPDWEPAVESARWMGLRVHEAWATTRSAERGIEPLWHETLGQPYVQRFRVHFASGALTWFEDFPAAPHFGDAAKQIATNLAEAGVLNTGDQVQYGLIALADRTVKPATPTSLFAAHEAASRLRTEETPVEAFLVRLVVRGGHPASDFDAFVPYSTIAEVEHLTEHSNACETGGILIGHLHRDPTSREIFAEVTAQVPARHTEAGALKLTFTSDTWTDVRSAIALRRRQEIMLGWWHSHPAREWCKACPIERQRVCTLARGFLSADDVALHRAVFPQAFTLALLATDAVTGLSVSLFGWRSGVLQPRNFRLLDVPAQEAFETDADHSLAGPVEPACTDRETPMTGGLDATPIVA